MRCGVKWGGWVCLWLAQVGWIAVWLADRLGSVAVPVPMVVVAVARPELLGVQAGLATRAGTELRVSLAVVQAAAAVAM